VPAWATTAEVRARTQVPDLVEDDTLALAILQASELLTGLSGLGPAVTTTVEPRPCPCGDVFTGPYDARDTGAAGLSGGSPFYWRVGTLDGGGLVLGGGCGHELVLPDNPVIEVTTVRVAGEVQDPATYELVDAARLRRLGGSSWASGRIQVTYTTGGSIGEAGLLAVAELARELGKAMTRGMKCAIPERVTSVVRDNVSFTMLDPQTFLDHGRTGLYWVDLFLASSAVLPATTVVSPDSPSYSRLRSTP
jgi:hypothetical protein